MVADAREREDAFALTIFNVLFGWTVVGWIAAYVWARHRVSEKRLANVVSSKRRALGRVTIAKIVARSRRVRPSRRQSTLSA
ncbi:superinfection immunity protein [Paraburkholderia sp. C35]|uniref:superinfection immunity protein n=1 Tax=Paraburkholderia sp. C35 TaxID=2126993 RepID=UPI0023B7E95C|nr:superinfection immunity protein [Paraburkholderia sp. C35]